MATTIGRWHRKGIGYQPSMPRSTVLLLAVLVSIRHQPCPGKHNWNINGWEDEDEDEGQKIAAKGVSVKFFSSIFIHGSVIGRSGDGMHCEVRERVYRQEINQ